MMEEHSYTGVKEQITRITLARDGGQPSTSFVTAMRNVRVAATNPRPNSPTDALGAPALRTPHASAQPLGEPRSPPSPRIR